MAFFGNITQNLITIGVIAAVGYFIYTKLTGGRVKDTIGKLFNNDNENLGGDEGWMKKK